MWKLVWQNSRIFFLDEHQICYTPTGQQEKILLEMSLTDPKKWSTEISLQKVERILAIRLLSNHHKPWQISLQQD